MHKTHTVALLWVKGQTTVSCHSCTFNGEFIIKAGHIAMTSSHPQGGLVAQALFGVKEFNSSWVTTIIALASPLRQPVLSFDYSLHQFYKRVHEVKCSTACGK